MKKLLLLIAIVAMVLPSCKKINEELDALGARLDKLEQESIPTIDEQIAAINTTLGNLDAMDKELKGYIDGLQATADNLQEQIKATNTKIDDVKVALQGEISTAKAEVLAELEALETELKNELAQINATIETLKDKDEELDKKIADLKTYVDTELGKTTDWVNATFATLEQYNALVSEVATIKEQIKAINQNITNLETRLTTKINEDIASAVSTLNANIQQKVKDITEAYTNAVKTTKEELTAAYTSAIQTAISNLETSLKSWVGEQLSNYYTIAQIDAKILALQTAIINGDSALQEELNKLKAQLETTKSEVTEAYKKAIKEAIETNNGVINAKIAEEIGKVNGLIEELNSKLAKLQIQVDKNTEDIAELLARIQSVSYIPTYDDGKATVKYVGSISQVTLDFEISPKDAVVELAKVWQSAVSVKAIYTQTRAVSFIDMPITNFESDATNGIISVTASAENLSAEFFAGTQSASVRLSISDGNNSVTSEYIPIATIGNAENTMAENCKIYYTTTNGVKLFPKTDASLYGAILILNIYKDGQGVLIFDDKVTLIGEYAFSDCTSLTSVTIPDSVTSIGNYAFDGCKSLTSVTIGSSVTTIGKEAFRKCTSLTSVTIPNSVTSIGSHAFYYCTSLTSVTIPNSVTSIGEYAFSGCTGELIVNCNICGYKNGENVYGTDILNGYSPFYNSEFEKITIGNSVTSIGYRAFEGSKSLRSITIPDSVTSIRSYAFQNCGSLTSVDIADLSAWCKISFGNSRANPLCDGAKLYLNGSELTEITIPSDITRIKNYAFYNCKSLTSITIPDGVTSIGASAFYNCSSLTSVYCKPTTPPTGASNMFNNNAADRKIYVPHNSVDAYKSAKYWSDYADSIVGYDF